MRWLWPISAFVLAAPLTALARATDHRAVAVVGSAAATATYTLIDGLGGRAPGEPAAALGLVPHLGGRGGRDEQRHEERAGGRQRSGHAGHGHSLHLIQKK